MINEISIKNTATGVVYVLNNYSATFLIEDGSINWGEVSVSHSTYNYPEQIGKFMSSTSVGARTITIYGWITGRGYTDQYAEIKRKKGLLNRFISPLQLIEITAGGYKITGKPDSQVKYSNTYEENNDVMCKFLISLYCANPVFEPATQSVLDVTKKIALFHFPLTIKSPGVAFGYRENSLFADINNDGIVPIGIIIEFKANGVVNNPALIDAETQEFIRINKSLGAGDIVTINTCNGYRDVTAVIDNVEQSYLQFLDFDSTWLQFSPGTSTVGFATSLNGVADETYKNLSITITYKTCLFNLEEE